MKGKLVKVDDGEHYTAVTLVMEQPKGATMNKDEALKRWGWGCAAIELKGRMVRNGNWHPLAQLLRHGDCDAAQVTVVEQDGSTILTIEPKAVTPPEGKSAIERPAFHLIVR